MPTQVQNGKAFEYALIHQANSILSQQTNVTIINNASYNSCLNCFNIFTAVQQGKYLRAAATAINHIILLEPRLLHATNGADILHLELQPDAAGQAGDVRDLIFTRPSQNWEIGISAKNNHMALKHSRLSQRLDFGTSWVNVPCSINYFNSIAPIFNQLIAEKALGTRWSAIVNKPGAVYKPILTHFEAELRNIDQNNPNIPQSLINYLVGRQDFYKVMKRNKVVEILAFNINGTLGKSAPGVRPAINVPRLLLPTQIVQSTIIQHLDGNLHMIFNQGWQLSFRIHNAETLVIPSLKFDINLIGQPNSMYSNHLPY